jgi:hypothetical protein
VVTQSEAPAASATSGTTPSQIDEAAPTEGSGQKPAIAIITPAEPKEAPPETAPETRRSTALDASPEAPKEASQSVQIDGSPDAKPTTSAEPDTKILGFVSDAGSASKAALPEHFLTAPDDPGPDTTATPPPAPPRELPNSEVDRLSEENLRLRQALEQLAPKILPQPPRTPAQAAWLLGFASEWGLIEELVTDRYRRLARIYHPDNGVAADSNRMAQITAARSLLMRHLKG